MTSNYTKTDESIEEHELSIEEMDQEQEKDPEIGLVVALLTYITFLMVLIVGHANDILGIHITGMSRYVQKKPKKGFAVLLKYSDSFYTRRLYNRIQDCWNRPICSNPGARIDVMERTSKDGNMTLELSNKTIRCVNVGSYNYLGFADDWKHTCKDEVFSALDKYPVGLSGSRQDLGAAAVHLELEKQVATFVGKEAAVVFSMGFNTNVTTIPCLVGKGSLIVSDALNHTSIVNGARASGAAIRVFKHNSAVSLEQILREAIVQGQPRHHRPWKKILVLVEGIYSMEGAICNLKAIAEVCKKCKAYLYVDEAHSIGALGRTGRGICEYTGVSPDDVDILMGTFTKSFGGMGGYIAGSKKMIEYLMSTCAGLTSHNCMSPIVAQQIITALKIISGEDGTNKGQQKLLALKNNSNFFRSEMKKLGLHVYGNSDSPIVPVMLYVPAKMAAFSRECLKRHVAVVVVGFPATRADLSRARFCISAGHSMNDLKRVVNVVDDVAQLLCMKYEKSSIGIDFNWVPPPPLEHDEDLFGPKENTE